MKKVLALIGLAAAALAAFAGYWSEHLTYVAMDKTPGPADRVKVLARASAWNPLDDRARFESGLARFQAAADNLGDAASRDASFRSALGDFQRSLRLSPGSLQGHFQFAQTLLYMTYLGLPTPSSSFEEYKKAAALTGHDSRIYFEVGKVFLTRWSALTPAERADGLEILRKMLAGRDLERLRAVLETWSLHIADYDIIRKILPEDAGMNRLYAEFLAERSLSLEERWRALAAAEALDFARAQADYEQGNRDLAYYQLADAAARLTAARDAIGRIRFYQALAHETSIVPADYAALRRAVALGLAKLKIDETGSLKEARPLLEAYLVLENDVQSVSALENDLRERSLLPSRDVAEVRDMGLLAFQLLLNFKQNRFREIVDAANQLAGSFLAVPEAMKPAYARVLRMIGDAYQKLDYVYESGSYYRRALEIEPDDLATLLAARKSYERLNDEAKIRDMEAKIASVLSPRELELAGTGLSRGESRIVRLVLDGGNLEASLSFASGAEGFAPLVAVYLNGRVAGEGALEEGILRVRLDAAPGPNELVIVPLNASVVPIRLTLRPLPGAAGPSLSPGAAT
jgi:hypothetical protein